MKNMLREPMLALAAFLPLVPLTRQTPKGYSNKCHTHLFFGYKILCFKDNV